MTTYHEPVLLDACLEGLAIRPEGTYVDATYGGGGHSKAILRQLGNKGRLIGFDQDLDAAANRPDDDRFIFVHHNFRFIRHFLMFYDILLVDGILADLGVSSHHFDSPQRGFSYRFEGDLDMRMNQSARLTAAQVLNNYDEEQLRNVFYLYGEIHNTNKLVATILSSRSNQPLVSIEQFIHEIKSCIPVNKENKYLAKVFQALRIEVNNELDSLKKLLEASAKLIRPGGRLVVISYHSLEDRLVKNFIRAGNVEGKVEKDFYGNVRSPFRAVNRKVILPGEKELEENPRSRSAKLRIAERL